MRSRNLVDEEKLDRKEIVVPFRRPLRQRIKPLEKPQTCIFCGTTLQIQTFKGKTVCYPCLQHIPTMFAL